MSHWNILSNTKQRSSAGGISFHESERERGREKGKREREEPRRRERERKRIETWEREEERREENERDERERRRRERRPRNTSEERKTVAPWSQIQLALTSGFQRLKEWTQQRCMHGSLNKAQQWLAVFSAVSVPQAFSHSVPSYCRHFKNAFNK